MTSTFSYCFEPKWPEWGIKGNVQLFLGPFGKIHIFGFSPLPLAPKEDGRVSDRAEVPQFTKMCE